MYFSAVTTPAPATQSSMSAEDKAGKDTRTSQSLLPFSLLRADKKPDDMFTFLYVCIVA